MTSESFTKFLQLILLYIMFQMHREPKLAHCIALFEQISFDLTGSSQSRKYHTWPSVQLGAMSSREQLQRFT
jgi:hypothetical protein